MKAMAALLTSLALSACNGETTPAATDYSKIVVPIDRLHSDEARERGRGLFRVKCSLCHGERADGNGVRSKGLSGKPVNFGSTDWRASTTPLAVYEVLREGKRGTSMPAWPTLSEEQTWDVVSYVLSVAQDGP